MDLEKALLYDHSQNNARRIQKFIGDNPNLYAEVVNLYLENKGLLAQHAIWVLSLCTEAYPHLVIPHLSKLVHRLENKGIDAASKRNTIRLLQFITIPVKFQGRVIDICYRYLLDPKEQISIRVFSMTVLTNLCQAIPALKPELLLVLEDQLPHASPGIVSRAKKSLRILRQ